MARQSFYYLPTTRQTAVDFTMPYMNTGHRHDDDDDDDNCDDDDYDGDDDDDDDVNCVTGVGILFKKDKPAPNNLFSFLQVTSTIIHLQYNSSSCFS